MFSQMVSQSASRFASVYLLQVDNRIDSMTSWYLSVNRLGSTLSSLYIDKSSHTYTSHLFIIVICANLCVHKHCIRHTSSAV